MSVDMMKNENSNVKNDRAKEKLVSRLKRIEGQVRGIQNMVDDERKCQDILQQLSAVRSAVESVSLILLEEYMTDCFINLDEKDSPERQEMVKDMLKMLGKTP